ncbi:hypothetical protein MTR67_048173 [Solanum verrucosum]|uniref:Uncharacterized protein n=1 Tax=Solanum verrucosum TaxID=315347 RepID=A0AAF0UXG7_SOLVR|nr:hypothetical protein MTR67_048173 [Solanum verrucosum]
MEVASQVKRGSKAGCSSYGRQSSCQTGHGGYSRYSGVRPHVTSGGSSQHISLGDRCYECGEFSSIGRELEPKLGLKEILNELGDFPLSQSSMLALFKIRECLGVWQGMWLWYPSLFMPSGCAYPSTVMDENHFRRWPWKAIIMVSSASKGSFKARSTFGSGAETYGAEISLTLLHLGPTDGRNNSKNFGFRGTEESMSNGDEDRFSHSVGKKKKQKGIIPEVSIFVPSIHVPAQCDLQRTLKGVIPKDLADRLTSIRNQIMLIAQDTALEEYLSLLVGLTRKG